MADPAQPRPARRRRALRPGSPSAALRWWWRTTWSDLPLEPDETRIERQLGWTRLVAAVGLALSMWNDVSGAPGWTRVLVWMSAGGFAMTAVATARVVRRTPTRRRVLEVLSLLDAVLIAMLLPFGVVRQSAYVILMFVLLAVVGSVRLGRFGVLRNLVIAAPFETARLVVGATSYGRESVEDTIVAVLAAIGVGVLVGDVATSGRRWREERTTAATAAATSRVRVRRLRWELEVVDDVVHASGNGRPREAVEEAVRRLAHHLDAARVDVLAPGRGTDLVVWCSTDPAAPAGSEVVLLPGGPRDRALSLGTMAAATHDDLAALAAADGRERGSVVAAPLPVAGQLVGVLVCETTPGDLLHRRDALLLGRLGRALAPFVRGAGRPPDDDGPTAADGARPEPAGVEGTG